MKKIRLITAISLILCCLTVFCSCVSQESVEKLLDIIDSIDKIGDIESTDTMEGIDSTDDTDSNDDTESIDEFDGEINVLIIEKYENESEKLQAMLQNEFSVTSVSLENDLDGMPKNIREMTEYEQIVLVNVANSDMPEGFDQLLHSYVHDFGGGLFTVGGNKFDADPTDDIWEANAYTRADMYGTVYQNMLPVEVIEYTPPTAVMILIDRSGSMQDSYVGGGKLMSAKEGAMACLDALSERDYVGIMSFADDVIEHLPLTSRIERDKILGAIDSIEANGGNTVLSVALDRAGEELRALEGVENRHIIVITDGEPTESSLDWCKKQMFENAEMGITMSIVGIQCFATAKNTMTNLLVNFAGMTEENFYDVQNPSDIHVATRNDLESPRFKTVRYETFTPQISGESTITQGIPQEYMPTLDGFYGVKAKEGAEVILMGEYTPIYAQWSYGEGRVGTFACDLNGNWSEEFIESEVGKNIIINIIRELCMAR